MLTKLWEKWIFTHSHTAVVSTRKDAVWSWGSAEQKAFDELKWRFTEKLVLSMVDTTKELRAEANTSESDYPTSAVLSMKDDNEKWHPCAYLSKGLNDVEQNYNIHDKGLLGVMCALEELLSSTMVSLFISL